MNDEEYKLPKSLNEYPLDLKTSSSVVKIKAPTLNTMPAQQRSAFGIQELLGLSDSNSNINRHHRTPPITAPSYNAASCFGPHPQMSLAAVSASRMAYFNAQAAVAAAYLSPNMNPLTAGTAPGSMLNLGNNRVENTTSGKYVRFINHCMRTSYTGTESN